MSAEYRFDRSEHLIVQFGDAFFDRPTRDLFVGGGQAFAMLGVGVLVEAHNVVLVDTYVNSL